MCDGHDRDYLSVISKAYLYSRKHAEFNPTVSLLWNDPMASETIQGILRRIPDRRRRRNIITDEIKNLQLYDWQRKAELALLSQNNKQILWIYDQEGGKLRKIKLRWISKYRYNAIILLNGTTADIAHIYKKEKYAIFDYTRPYGEVNYNVIENLKNGIIFARK